MNEQLAGYLNVESGSNGITFVPAGKGQNWHYYSPKKGFGSAATRHESQILIPEYLRQVIPGYHSLATIQVQDKRLLICAIPEKGGPYAVLLADASPEDAENIRTESGLRNFLQEHTQREPTYGTIDTVVQQ